MDSKSKAFSYQTRLFFLIIVFTWILAFSFFALQYTREREYRVDSVNSNLQIYNKLLLNFYEKGEFFDNPKIAEISSIDSIRVTVIDFAGQVLYDSANNNNITENHSSRKEVKEALDKGAGFTVQRVSEVNNNEYFYSATKGRDVVMRTAIHYDLPLLDIPDADMVNIWIIIFIASTLSVIAYFATRRIGQSVRNLRDFANQAKKGDISNYNIESFPDDELGEISADIINLYKRLEKTTKERDENLKNVIFEEQEKTRIKHQLTNNINHELKTPVHAIQGCLETIVNNKEQLDKEMIISLAEKAYQNIIRLCTLMQDISTITHITEASSEISKVPLNINAVVTKIKNEVSLLPIEKQLRVNVTIPENVDIVGNENLIEAIFRNLVNNSIAYSGGRDIFITMLEETPEYYTFKLWDNGIGVEEEHLTRLFERFYRVDSGRSRKLGGTGLGLSIVKNAVQFHNGTISANNSRQGGIEFTFTLHK